MTQLYALAAAYQTIARLIEEDDENDWTQALETLTDSIR